ncbi:TetR/AcrR family transcriptional regulator [Microbacterium esteraromaticum]|uniref:TetR/AcrR family transcriptional regulator n=1 Tax=Microbacterium esteraromaticum TaxID=57043 RepID=A0A7D8AN25_9MICO|nr:TetR/AcrR family transcriptional regulator [Microbacterium esteraromaticum]QMU98487.1 TetR/AcrR family transcriptional regulator [Microbacterium esteraromaticum]
MAKQERAIATRENILQAGARLFSRKHYEAVRIAELLAEASVTQGGFYFHFPTGKKGVAEELILRQDGRLTAVREAAVADADLDGLSALILFLRRIVTEIEHDIVMQAGLRLVIQAAENFPEVAHMPHPSWNAAIEGALMKAQADAVLRDGVDAVSTARALVLLFIGAQTSSFINDQWRNASATADVLVQFILTSIAAPGFVPADDGVTEA